MKNFCVESRNNTRQNPVKVTGGVVFVSIYQKSMGESVLAYNIMCQVEEYGSIATRVYSHKGEEVHAFVTTPS